jgi:general nucleoside transport system permease protein
LEPLIVLQFAAPTALAAIGETVGQKSGVINIGLEGSMLIGAFFAMLVSLLTQSPWLGVAAGVGAGTALSLVSAIFCIRLAADQVVVGTAINLIALGLTNTLFRARFSQTGQLISVPRIPSYGQVDPVMVVMVLSVPAIWFLLYRTNWGLAVRAAGEYPKSAEAAGFSVDRLRFGALLISGAFAGLGGSYLALGIAGSFAENMTAGRGFVAIAMVTFGRWHPALVFAAALLVGYVDSLQIRFQSLGWNLPFQLMIALPYVVALLVLVLVGKGTVAPGALAVSYKREK